MKIRKGEVYIYISPSEWVKYQKAGWKQTQERSQALNKKYNETKKLKKQGKVENAK